MPANPAAAVVPMRIGELAERSGKTIRTLHFYEELGLLEPVSRTKGGFRLYDEQALLRIEWIARLQDLGFSLPDIQTFLSDLHAQPSGPAMMTELRSFYAQKLSTTREQVARLRALELQLQSSILYLSTCKACAPATEKTRCHTCDDTEHQGKEPPMMVAAVSPQPSPHPTQLESA